MPARPSVGVPERAALRSHLAKGYGWLEASCGRAGLRIRARQSGRTLPWVASIPHPRIG